MNKSIDICTKVIYNIDNSKSPLCILRNYTRAKLQGSKTGSKLYNSSVLNYTRAKLQGSKTYFFVDVICLGTTPVQNCRGVVFM